MGGAGAEECWASGRGTASGEQGWFPCDAVLQVPLPPGSGIADATAPSDALWLAVARTTVKGVAPGYLALAVGDKLKVQYVGSLSQGDAGWLFGRSAAGRGWFPTAALET